MKSAATRESATAATAISKRPLARLATVLAAAVLAVALAPAGAQPQASAAQPSQSPLVGAQLISTVEGAPLATVAQSLANARSLVAQDGSNDPQDDLPRPRLSFKDFSPEGTSENSVTCSVGGAASWSLASCALSDGTVVEVDGYTFVMRMQSGATNPEDAISISVSDDGEFTVTAAETIGEIVQLPTSVYVSVTANPKDAAAYGVSYPQQVIVQIEAGATTAYDLSGATVKVTNAEPLTFNASPQVPDVAVYLNGQEVPQSEYTLLYFRDEAGTQPLEAADVVNAGTYYVKAQAVGTNNYQGTTDAASFEIEKATRVLSVLDSSSYKVDEITVNLIDHADGLPLTVQNYISWGSIAVTLEDDEDAAIEATYADGTLTIVPKKRGSATVKLSATGGQNYEDADATVQVTVVNKQVKRPTFQPADGLTSFNELTYVPGKEQVGVKAVDDDADNAKGYTVSGTTGTNAGNGYEATAEPNDGYEWAPDPAAPELGANDNPTQQWSIGKATPRIVADPSGAITLDTVVNSAGLPVNLTLYVGDVALTDEADLAAIEITDHPDGTVADASIQSPAASAHARLTLRPVDAGTTSVTLTSAEADNLEPATPLVIPITVQQGTELVERPDVTVVSPSPAYDGTPQTGVTMVPATSEAYTLTGDVQTASNEDGPAYQAIVKLNAGYAWEDGGTEDLVYDWYIVRGAPRFASSSTDLLFDLSNPAPSTVTITYDGDGTVQCASADPSIATAVYNESAGTVTITPVALGATTVTLTASSGQNYTAPEDITIAVSVSDSIERVAVPEIKLNTGLVYDGTEHIGAYLDPADVKDEAYTLQGDRGVNAGDYTASLELAPGYVWENGSRDPVAREWAISPSSLGSIEVTPLVALNLVDYAEGYELQVAYTSLDGNIPDWTTLTPTGYDASIIDVAPGQGASFVITPKALGTTPLVIRASGGSNYAPQSTTVQVTVGAKRVEKPTIDAVDAGTTYDGNLKIGYDVHGGDPDTYDVEGLEATDAGTYTTRVKLHEGLLWEDGTSDDIVRTWTIGKADASISVDSGEVTMNPVFDATGRTVAVSSYTGDGTVSVSSSDPRVVRATYAANDPEDPTTGGVITLVPVGVGSAQVSVLASEGKNYKAIDGQNDGIDVTVANYQVDRPSVRVEGGLVYNGSPQTGVSVSPNLPDRYQLSGQTQTDAGDYQAVVSLQPGYEWSAGESFTDDIVSDWSISRAEAALSLAEDSVSLNAIDDSAGRAIAVTYEFGGVAVDAMPRVNSSQPSVADATYANGVLTIFPHVAGDTTITMTMPETRNFEEASATVEVAVTAKPVEKPTITVLPAPEYNGSAQEGVAVTGGVPGSFTVTGNSQVNAGDYTARVVLNPGYEWVDGADDPIEADWSISKSSHLAAAADSVVVAYDGNPHRLVPYAYDALTNERVQADIVYLQADGTFTDEAPSATDANADEPLVVVFKAVGNDNYEDAAEEASATITINPSSAMEVTVDGTAATYDGLPHGVSVSAEVPDAQVLYLDPETGEYTLEESPTQLNAGTLQVGYRVIDPAGNYLPYEGVAALVVAPADTTVTDEPTGVVAQGDVFADLGSDGNIVVMEVVNLGTSNSQADAQRFAELRSKYFDATTMDSLSVYSVKLSLVNAASGDVVRELTEDFGELALQMPVAGDYEGRNVSVLELHGAQSQEIDLGTQKVASGKVAVSVEQLSEFVITVEAEANEQPSSQTEEKPQSQVNDTSSKTTDTPNGKTTTKAASSPATGDNVLAPIVLALVLVALAAAATLTRITRRS